jgi:translocator protein
MQYILNNKIVTLIACIVLCILMGSAPTLLSIDALKNWFPTIIKPSWNPPSYLFGPVWTLLFTQMGISIWQILHTNNSSKPKAYRIFIIQFALNLLWTILFFTLQSPGLALIEIILLLLSIAYTIITFYKIKKSAAYLLIPYFAWVSFATVLNATIYVLNK